MATPTTGAPTTKNNNATPTPAIKPVPTRTAHTDPQPLAPQIKPGLSDRHAHHPLAATHHKPSALQIERRAYEIWQRRGGGDGNAAVDWLQAERELLTEINARNAD